jgi:hypothetical protein
MRGTRRARRTPAGVVHPERLEDARLGELVEGLAADAFDDPAEDVGTEVGIVVQGTGALLQARLEDLLLGLGGGAGGLPQLPPGREAGAVREEVLDGHLVLHVPGELGQVALDGGLEVELALVVEDHRGGGGGDDLREGGEVVDALFRDDGGAGGGPTEPAVALLPDGVPLSPDHDGCPGVGAGGDAAADDPVNGGEAIRGHADGAGGSGGEALPERQDGGEGYERDEHCGRAMRDAGGSAMRGVRAVRSTELRRDAGKCNLYARRPGDAGGNRVLSQSRRSFSLSLPLGLPRPLPRSSLLPLAPRSSGQPSGPAG